MSTSLLRLSLLILALAAPANMTAQENLTMKIPPGWEINQGQTIGSLLGNVQNQKNQSLVEIVKKGEKVESWGELITFEQFRRPKGSPSTRQFYDALRTRTEERCPGLSDWRIVEEAPDSIVYEWNTTNPCEGHPAQWELARLIFGKHTGYRLAYTTREQFTTETRATWGEWLHGVSIGR